MTIMFYRYKKVVLVIFLIFTGISAYYTTKLQFSFSFDQFFPKDDPDFLFYQKFIEDFETDDNFLLIGIPHAPSVFDSNFLNTVHLASTDIQSLTNVRQVRSITNLSYPVKTPFGFMTIPAVHLEEPARYGEDKKTIFEDTRIVNNLINETGDALCIFVKTTDNLGLPESIQLINSLDSVFAAKGIKEKHYLGRAYFQKELVHFQTDEIKKSTIISGILITILLWFLYRQPMAVFITLSTVGLGLVIFMGMLGMMGTQLTALSALFPILMLIVGSSDVIHIYTKYTDEMKWQSDHKQAMWNTLKHIGLATLITSLTTAFGFASLSTSKLETIREFGLQSALGVIVAYLAVLFYMVPLLLIFPIKNPENIHHGKRFWQNILEKVYRVTSRFSGRIIFTSWVMVVVLIFGISLIKTNYSIVDNLPHHSKVREDFLYFENNFGGFRPLEYAVIVHSGSSTAEDYDVVRQVNLLEEKLLTYPFVKTVLSQATVYKSLARSFGGNQSGSYVFPEDIIQFQQFQDLMKKVKSPEQKVLVSKDGTKTRISARIQDIGADRIAAFGHEVDGWINQNLDTSQISFQRTGTGFIMDKNSVYVKENLLQGLGISLVLISLLMGLMLRSLRMVIISLIPNIIPLLVTGAILGYFGIDLEAGISIVFAIIFGIAVDDTIHFLAKYKLCLSDGLDQETAIQKSIMETGKAIIFTSLVLSLGFLVMVFSYNPPTYTIGILISATLFSALICDLFLLPVLLRKWHKV